MFDDTYKTIERSGKGIFRDRASKFIGLALPAGNEAEVKSLLTRLRKEYWDANHHCFAYVLGFDKSATRMNDDGEPSGTAGRPIMGQITSRDLTNILIVVIRYFGGTKLGVSGLINAYKQAASLALDDAPLLEKTVNEVYVIHFEYERMNDVMRILKDEKLEQINHQFGLNCSLEFRVRKRDAERITGLFQDLREVQISYVRTE